MPDNNAADLAGRLDTIEALLVRHLKVDENIESRQTRWHLKKEVTITHLLSTIGIVGIVITSWFTLSGAVQALDTRTANITDARIVRVESRIDSTESYMRENLQSINGALAVITDKIDTLNERTIENRENRNR